MNGDGRREILGLDVVTAEDGAGWLAFLRGLRARGLKGGGDEAVRRLRHLRQQVADEVRPAALLGRAAQYGGDRVLEARVRVGDHELVIEPSLLSAKVPRLHGATVYTRIGDGLTIENREEEQAEPKALAPKKHAASHGPRWRSRLPRSRWHAAMWAVSKD